MPSIRLYDAAKGKIEEKKGRSGIGKFVSTAKGLKKRVLRHHNISWLKCANLTVFGLGRQANWQSGPAPGHLGCVRQQPKHAILPYSCSQTGLRCDLQSKSSQVVKKDISTHRDACTHSWRTGLG